MQRAGCRGCRGGGRPRGAVGGEGEARGWPMRPRVRACMAKALRPSRAAPTPPPGAPGSRPRRLACHCVPESPPEDPARCRRAGLPEGPSPDVPHPRLQGGTELSRVVLEARASPRFWGWGWGAQMPPGRGPGLRGLRTATRRRQQVRVCGACPTHSRLRPGRRPFLPQRFSSSFPKPRAAEPTTSAGC